MLHVERLLLGLAEKKGWTRERERLQVEEESKGGKKKPTVDRCHSHNGRQMPTPTVGEQQITNPICKVITFTFIYSFFVYLKLG